MSFIRKNLKNLRVWVLSDLFVSDKACPAQLFLIELLRIYVFARELLN